MDLKLEIVLSSPFRALKGDVKVIELQFSRYITSFSERKSHTHEISDINSLGEILERDEVLNEHISNRDNPHEVTANELGINADWVKEVVGDSADFYTVHNSNNKNTDWSAKELTAVQLALPSSSPTSPKTGVTYIYVV